MLPSTGKYNLIKQNLSVFPQKPWEGINFTSLQLLCWIQKD